MCECPVMYEEHICAARKPHRCCECGAQIKKGERYQSASGMWDGHFARFSTCLPCADIRQELVKHADVFDCCELPAFGELREYLAEDLPATIAAVAAMDARAPEQRSEGSK